MHVSWGTGTKENGENSERIGSTGGGQTYLVTFQMFRVGYVSRNATFRPLLVADKFHHAASPSDNFGEVFRNVFLLFTFTSSSMMTIYYNGQNVSQDREATFEQRNISDGALFRAIPTRKPVRDHFSCDLDD